jgi:hypothetical protein
MPRATYTLAALEVSTATYDEIAKLLRDAGYHHVFHDGGIDMTHILLVCAPERDPTKQCPACSEKAAELTCHGDAERRFFCVARCGQPVWGVPFGPREEDL